MSERSQDHSMGECEYIHAQDQIELEVQTHIHTHTNITQLLAIIYSQFQDMQRRRSSHKIHIYRRTKQHPEQTHFRGLSMKLRRPTNEK